MNVCRWRWKKSQNFSPHTWWAQQTVKLFTLETFVIYGIWITSTCLNNKLVKKLIRQYASCSSMFCPLHNNISKEQHEKHPCSTLSQYKKYERFPHETGTPYLDTWKVYTKTNTMSQLFFHYITVQANNSVKGAYATDSMLTGNIYASQLIITFMKKIMGAQRRTKVAPW